MKQIFQGSMKSLFFALFLLAFTVELGADDTIIDSLDKGSVITVVRTTKALLDKRADWSVVQLFGASFDPRNSRLIGFEEIHKFINEEKIVVKMLPERVQKALGDENTIGLLVPKFHPKPGVPYRMSDTQRAVMLHWMAEGWDDNFWIQGIETGSGSGGGSGEEPDPGPCNGEYLEACTGCQGFSRHGTHSICLCVNSCKVERPCPPCLEEIPVEGGRD